MFLINCKKKSKIIVRLSGGLGNQLFTYAAARRLAIENNSELVIDHLSGFIFDKKYNRNYQLDNFSIPFRKANFKERLEPFGRLKCYLYRRYNYFLPFKKRFFLTQEKIGFDSRLLELKILDTLYFEGYWQSENYFKDIELIIKNDLAIKQPKNNKFIKLSKIMEKKNSVAIHVRFFKNNKSSQQFELNENYYRKAINIINNKFKNVHFFIFSNKPSKVKDLIFISQNKYTLVSHKNQNSNPHIDFWLMTKCKHFIIANSTFSWWGAWLSNNKNKLIIAPKDVVLSGEGAWGFKGLLPSRWVRI